MQSKCYQLPLICTRPENESLILTNQSRNECWKIRCELNDGFFVTCLTKETVKFNKLLAKIDFFQSILENSSCNLNFFFFFVCLLNEIEWIKLGSENEFFLFNWRWYEMRWKVFSESVIQSICSCNQSDNFHGAQTMIKYGFGKRGWIDSCSGLLCLNIEHFLWIKISCSGSFDDVNAWPHNYIHTPQTRNNRHQWSEFKVDCFFKNSSILSFKKFKWIELGFCGLCGEANGIQHNTTLYIYSHDSSITHVECDRRKCNVSIWIVTCDGGRQTE